MDDKELEPHGMDDYTFELLKELFDATDQSVSEFSSLSEELTDEIDGLIKATEYTDATSPIVHLFTRLKEISHRMYSVYQERPWSCLLKNIEMWMNMG